jgi:hypothetical protein
MENVAFPFMLLASIGLNYLAKKYIGQKFALLVLGVLPGAIAIALARAIKNDPFGVASNPSKCAAWAESILLALAIGAWVAFFFQVLPNPAHK